MANPEDVAEASVSELSQNQDESPAVSQVFSMFKTYLKTKLEEIGEHFETKSKLDKQVTQLRFKGNQEQFELNTEIGSFFDKIRYANFPGNKAVDDLISEGKELIRIRQKFMIRISDKSIDGWKVVDEYVSDELASESDDEKRLKKAKEAASRKGRQLISGRRGSDKRFKGPSNSIDQQVFLGEVALGFVFSAVFFAAYFCLWVVCLLSRMLGCACDPPISLVIPVLRIFKG